MRNLFILLGLLMAFDADADTLKRGFPICESETAINQMYAAIVDKDMRGMDYLFDHGCLMTTPAEVSVLERRDSLAHVRVYSTKHAAEAWVSVGAVGP